jgi:hypothetical protein
MYVSIFLIYNKIILIYQIIIKVITKSIIKQSNNQTIMSEEIKSNPTPLQMQTVILESLEEKHMSILTIPAGTRVAPYGRMDNAANLPYGSFYITLEDDIRIIIDRVHTVNINSINYNVIPSLITDAEYSTNNDIRQFRLSDQNFKIKAGVKYHINDVLKDPIGLSHKFNIDQNVILEPESVVILSKNSRIVQNDPQYLANVNHLCVNSSCVGNNHHNHNPQPNDLFCRIHKDIRCII